jgi:hypothetical protein
LPKKTTKAKYLHDMHTFMVLLSKIKFIEMFFTSRLQPADYPCLKYIENIFSVNIKLKPKLSDFLLDLHQFLAHQGLAKSLYISIGMPALFASLAAHFFAKNRST